MFTTWEQVESWITDNNFKRWILYRDAARTEKIIDSRAFSVSDTADKLAMTEKYLRMSGGRAYGSGFADNGKDDATVCEIRLEAELPAAGVGFQPIAAMPDEAAIEKRIEARLRAEMEKKEYEKLRADLDRERKEFEQEKASAMGAIAHYFAPIGQALLGQRRMVAGVDAEEPVHAKPIIPETQEPQEQEQEEDVFTEEEENKLYTLLARFKKVEPQYMELIEAVVKMAESGDMTYNMAKGALLK